MNKNNFNHLYFNCIPAIKEFIVENFLFGEDNGLTEETSFFEKGIIDSAGIMELISFIEETYQIKVEDEELIPENFSSLEKVNKYLQQKINVGIE
jgi:acyl carrier protein